LEHRLEPGPDHAADKAGLMNFVAALNAGSRDEQIVAALVGSDEYFARL
jgi:hypothetical protein